MSAKLTGHFKKFYNPNYIGSWCIVDGEEPVYTIKDLAQEEVSNGKTSENLLVVYFKEKTTVDGKPKDLPLILNKTNADTISKLYGSNVEGWIGGKIELWVDHNVEAFGSKVDGTRVRKPTVKKPVKKLVLTPKSPKWEKAIQSAKDGMSIEDMRAHYDITDANYKLLLK